MIENNIRIFFSWWCILMLPALSIAQNFEFINLSTSKKIFDYDLSIESHNETMKLFPNKNGVVFLSDLYINSKNHSIYINYNFNKIFIEKSSFVKPQIRLDFDLKLDEIVIKTKKSKSIKKIGVIKGYKPPLIVNNAIIIAIPVDRLKNYFLESINIKLKGPSLFQPIRNLNSSFELVLFATDSTLNEIEPLLDKRIKVQIERKSSQNLILDVKEYNIQIDSYDFILVGITDLSNSLAIKCASIKKNPNIQMVKIKRYTDSTTYELKKPIDYLPKFSLNLTKY